MKEFDAEKYRSSLAGKLKEIRSSNDEAPSNAKSEARGYLKAKKETTEYQKVKDRHVLEVKKVDKERQIKEHGREWFLEFAKDKKVMQESLAAIDEMINCGVFFRTSGTELDLPSGITEDLYDLKTLYKSAFEMKSRAKVANTNVDYEGLKRKYPLVYDHDYLSESMMEAIGFTKIQHYSQYDSACWEYRASADRKKKFDDFVQRFRKSDGVIEKERLEREEVEEKKRRIAKEIEVRKKELDDLG